MDRAIANPSQVTPQWLTGLLQVRGLLPQGRAAEVTAGEGQSTFASCVWHLDVKYSEEVPAGPPGRLFLKCSNPSLAPGEFDPAGLLQEIIFYQTIAPEMDESFSIPCYSAAYEPETGASHILLRDVSETHIPVSRPPSQENYEQAVDALAQLHAFWWDHSRLGNGIGSFTTVVQRQQEFIQTQEAAAAFVARVGEELPLGWRNIYERVLPALPNLFKRHATGKNLTIAHGDAHLNNFLFPIEANAGTAYMLDWQFWHLTIGGTDLAFLLASESEIETRRLYEQALLKRYYERLRENAVRNYTWNDCWDDYRLSVILVSIFIPVWRWSLFHWEVDHCALERAMTAFEDLNCSEFLPG